MKLQTSHALGQPDWDVAIRWPDGERAQIEVCAASPEAAEQYARDIWGNSITVTVSPKGVAR